MTSVSKNVHIDKLGNIANKYNNTYRSRIKIKLVDKKSSIFMDSNKECQNMFAKDYTLDWCEEDFVIKKVKIL